MKLLLKVLVLSVFVTACATMEYEEPNGSLCISSVTKPQPDWVNNRYSLVNDDLIYGLGQKEFSEQFSIDSQYKSAIINARTEIAESLEVKISNDIEIIEQRANFDANTTSKSIFNQRIKVNTEQVLTNTKVQDTWQDPSSCSVYALVTMPKETSTLIQKRSLVDTLYSKASDENTDLETRSVLLNNAINTALDYEFSRLPNSLSSKELTSKFNRELLKVEKQIRIRKKKFTLLKGARRIVETPYGLVQYKTSQDMLLVAFPQSEEITQWQITFRLSSDTDLNDIQGKSFSLSSKGFCPQVRKSKNVSSMCGKLRTKAQGVKDKYFDILVIPKSEIRYQSSDYDEARVIVETLTTEQPKGSRKQFKTTYYPEPSPTTYGKKLYGGLGIRL
jgi:hypothetical protein